MTNGRRNIPPHTPSPPGGWKNRFGRHYGSIRYPSAYARTVGEAAFNYIARTVGQASGMYDYVYERPVGNLMKRLKESVTSSTVVDGVPVTSDIVSPTETNMAQNTHGGVGNKYAKMTVHKGLRPRDLGETMRLSEQTVGYLSAQSGYQSVFDMVYLGSKDQFNGPVTNTPGPSQSSSIIYDLNPNKIITGSTKIPSISPANDKIFWDSGSITFEFVNASSHAVQIDLYFLVANKTANLTPVNAFQEGVVDDGLGTSVVGTTTSSGVTASSGRGLYYIPGTRATQFDNFNRYWKTKQVHRFRLAGAATYTYNMRYKHNTTCAKQNTLSDTYIKGVTMAVMGVVRGAPIVSDVSEGNDIPTYSSAKVGWICEKKYLFKSIDDNNRVKLFQQGYHVPTAVPLLNQKEVDNDDNVDDIEIAS